MLSFPSVERRVMTKGSKLLLYLFLGGPVLVVLLFLLTIGPVGWFVAGFLVLGVMVIRSFTEDTEQAPRKGTARNVGSEPSRPRDVSVLRRDALTVAAVAGYRSDRPTAGGRYRNDLQQLG